MFIKLTVLDNFHMDYFNVVKSSLEKPQGSITHTMVLANTKIHVQHTHAKDEAEHLYGTCASRPEI